MLIHSEYFEINTLHICISHVSYIIRIYLYISDVFFFSEDDQMETIAQQQLLNSCFNPDTMFEAGNTNLENILSMLSRNLLPRESDMLQILQADRDKEGK